MAINSQNAYNLLVPAFGNTQVVPVRFPSVGLYTFDWRSYLVEDSTFRPQSVTVNATTLPAGESVLFSIPLIGFSRTIAAGRSETFSFPALESLIVTLMPSDGISAFNTHWYNFPAFPDVSGPDPVTFSGSLTADFPPATGSTVTRVNAAITDTLLLAANSARKGAIFFSEQGSADVKILLGTTAASATNYSAELVARQSLTFVRGDYTGEVRAIWAAALGAIQITEVT